MKSQGEIRIIKEAQMAYTILVINPGSTSTKIAVYKDESQVFVKSVEHEAKDLARFEKIISQFELRRDHVLEALKENNVHTADLSGVIGRGGQLPGIKAGGYRVNEAMLRDLRDKAQPHASNLGAAIAWSIASPLGIPAFIYDAVTTDELCDSARVTGFPEVSRMSFCHALNSRAMARKAAAVQGGDYRQKNFIVAHLGGGFSFSAHERGRIIDVITDDFGPFTPERSGRLPLGQFIPLCYCGEWNETQMMNKAKRQSGLLAHLGTNDARTVEAMIAQGDSRAKLVYDAMIYQIAKGIGELAPTLWGANDGVILTGGLAHSTYLTEEVTRRVKFLGQVYVMRGESEMEALSLGALRILRGEETYHEYE
jgi:butyrate kinase